jgi:hypothetical protein
MYYAPISIMGRVGHHAAQQLGLRVTALRKAIRGRLHRAHILVGCTDAAVDILQKTPFSISVSRCFLCLSRACLGKRAVFSSRMAPKQALSVLARCKARCSPSGHLRSAWARAAPRSAISRSRRRGCERTGVASPCRTTYMYERKERSEL